MAWEGRVTWRGGSLLNCCKDCDVCCKTCWCPCFTYKEIRDGLHGGYSQDSCDPALLYLLVCCFTGWQCILGMRNRSEIRRKYGLQQSCCGDYCVHCCCHLCALCQEARELRSRPLTPWPLGDGATPAPCTGNVPTGHQSHHGYAPLPGYYPDPPANV